MIHRYTKTHRHTDTYIQSDIHAITHTNVHKEHMHVHVFMHMVTRTTRVCQAQTDIRTEIVSIERYAYRSTGPRDQQTMQTMQTAHLQTYGHLDTHTHTPRPVSMMETCI